MKVSNLCNLCDTYEETYIHLFCTCKKVKYFGVGINQWINEQTETLIHLNDVAIRASCPKDVQPRVYLIYL